LTSEKNKILLINPRVKWISSPAYDRVWPPLSLAYSGAMLEEHGFKVEILDANAQNTPFEKIIDKAKHFDKIFLTTSPLDKWQCPEPDIQSSLDLIKNISQVNPDIHVTGAHGTVRSEDVLQLTNAKTVIIGEPEQVILELCQEKNYQEIHGISYKKNNRIVTNEKRESVDINKLPLPAFHLLPMEEYYYEILGDHFSLFEGSRGCPFLCSYCFKSMYNKKYRVKLPDKLISEVRYGIEKHNIKNAYFIDLEFCANKNLVTKLCDFLIKERYDFNWTCQTRFDTIDSELLKKMKKAGCKIIHFGVESGSQRILDKIGKQASLAQMKNMMKLVKKTKIKTVCFFMFGSPTETKREMKMTIQLAKELNPTYASFHIAVPYPETKFFNTVKNDIKTSEFFSSHYGNKEELEKIRRKAYKSFYLRPRYFFMRITKGDLNLLMKQTKLFYRYINRGKG